MVLIDTVSFTRVNVTALISPMSLEHYITAPR